MIVDVHTHCFSFQDHTTSHVKDDMARCGIDPATWEFSQDEHLQATQAADVAVVFGMQAAATGWRTPNDFVAEHVNRAPDRLIFFASVDPGQNNYEDELRRCHEDLHCAGVKLGPIYQGVHPLDKRYYEIYRYCQKHSLPIMIHMATTFSSGVPLEYAKPSHMDQVAVDFPDLKIVLAHMGHPWEHETIAAIRKQPNLFADVSALYYRPWQFYNSMRLLCEYGAGDKVLFGSDFPATTTADSIEGLRAVNDVVAQAGLPPVSEAVIEDIIHRDALNLLGIEDPRKRENK